MTDDSDFNLPVRKTSKVPYVPNNIGAVQSIPLTEQHVGQLIETGSKAIEGGVAIAHDLLEIVRLREQTKSEVELIEARKCAVIDQFRLEVECLTMQQKTVRTRTEAAILVLREIREIIQIIPEADHGSRTRAIDALSDLVKSVVLGS